MAHHVNTTRWVKLLFATVGACLLIASPASNSVANDLWLRALQLRDRWTADELRVLSTLRLSQLPAARLDPSNGVDGVASAIELGKRLFNDPQFSRNQKVSCASCHDAKKQFQDGLAVGQGVGVGSRRTMPIVGPARSPWLFWDGRKDSLWAQALGPLEDAVEHGGNRTNYARRVQTSYRANYEAIFGDMPDLAALPANASPKGTATEQAAWKDMRTSEQQGVNRIFANMGKAIAAYEKTLAHEPTRFDRFVEATVSGNPIANQTLTPQEVGGLRIFIGKGQCVTCHNGPLFSDQHFHNTAVPPRDPAKPDRGRGAAIVKVLSDEFNCLGPFSDAKPTQCQELRFIATDDASMEGAFKTPGLRGVSLRPPYMHAGQFASIEEVIDHYVRAPAAIVGHTELAHGATGHTERAPIRLSTQEIKDLASFLATLSSPAIGNEIK
jgi:cytochrome c peroxidase